MHKAVAYVIMLVAMIYRLNLGKFCSTLIFSAQCDCKYYISNRRDSQTYSKALEKEAVYSASHEENTITLWFVIFSLPLHLQPETRSPQLIFGLSDNRSNRGTLSLRMYGIFAFKCDGDCLSSFDVTKLTLDCIPMRIQWRLLFPRGATNCIANIGTISYHQSNKRDNRFKVWCLNMRIVNAWKGGLSGWYLPSINNGFRVIHAKIFK